MLSTYVRSIINAINRCQEHHHCYLQMSGTSSMLSTYVRSIINAIYRRVRRIINVIYICQEHPSRYLQMSGTTSLLYTDASGESSLISIDGRSIITDICRW